MSEAQKIPRRDEVPLEHTWDLTKVYASDAAWEADVAVLEGMLATFVDLQGQVGESAVALLQALKQNDDIGMRLWQIYVYANRRLDSDSGDASGQALAERAGSLVARAGAAAAFLDPEILDIPEEMITAWQREEPDLEIYAYRLDQLMRQRAHIRSAEVEGIMAEFGDITRASGEIFDMLTNADLKFPMIEDENGHSIEISHGRYGRFLESRDRRVRRDTFKAYYSGFQGIRNTLGMTLAAEVRNHALNARLRDYDSSLEAALSANDIPVDVYHNLLETIDANLPRLHRYLRIRRRLMELDEQHIYDLYAPLVPGVDITVPYAEATQTLLAALAPLGDDYVAGLRQAFSDRWIDVYENVGKRSGAYSDGAYTTVPYVLLNYQDRLDDMFTLAHEMGHSMHSFFTRRTQPFVYGHYTIFVAEVASTLNESLLTHYMLKNNNDPALRKHLIVQQIEDIRRVIFRQAMFADFELSIHQRAEVGDPLTTDSLSKPYYDLVARYHGAEVTLDDEIALEWARIPHFYNNFYVYQYATGLSAALALSEQIIGEGQPVVDRYLTFLSSGASRPSIDLLRDAGVDMATPAPVQAAMDRFDALLDELESEF